MKKKEKVLWIIAILALIVILIVNVFDVFDVFDIPSVLSMTKLVVSITFVTVFVAYFIIYMVCFWKEVLKGVLNQLWELVLKFLAFWPLIIFPFAPSLPLSFLGWLGLITFVFLYYFLIILFLHRTEYFNKNKTKNFEPKNEVILITVFFNKLNNEKFSKNDKDTCISECSKALDSLVPLLHSKPSELLSFQILYKNSGDGSFWCEFSIIVVYTGWTALNIAAVLPQAMHMTGLFLENFTQYLNLNTTGSTTAKWLLGTAFRLTPGSRAALEKDGSDVSKQCLIEYHRPRCFGVMYDGRRKSCKTCPVLGDCRIKAGKG
ncbi:MAG: hypothetical protein FWD31_07575 [Planctomycetaceae bacterium]|nr:hypothetical protein [Planctomycetaceae bacterium]